jgi:hypothetical protein
MIEIPKRLRTRPRDRRGYPVPFSVYIDRTGRPQFTITDPVKLRACIGKRLCGLCGGRIDAGYWFVGGERCFTHELGAFIDPPMHEECARYAIRVCPFLAAPSYAKRIDDRLMPAPIGGEVLVKDNTMADERPAVFGLGMTTGYTLVRPSPLQTYFRADGWAVQERWRHGEQLTEGEDRT